MKKHKSVVCPSCFGKKMRERDFYRYRDTKRRRYLCQDCGHITAFPLRRKPLIRRRRAI